MTPIIKTVMILLMTFNIRYNNPADGINSWDNRKDIVIDLIQNHSPDLLGLQEVTGTQLNYLIESLNGYGFFGESRSEDPDDERSPIFYKEDKFDLVESNTFWLSETPDVPSKGWDAALNRIVTWAKFKYKESGKILFHFNTHFDHEGEKAKLESAKLLKEKIDEIAGESDYVVTGDFNFDPSSEAYKIITGSDQSSAILKDASRFPGLQPKGPAGTFTGFDSKKDPVGPIDYIFVKRTISVNSFEVIDTTYNGKLPSDHYPVKAELEMEAE